MRPAGPLLLLSPLLLLGAGPAEFRGCGGGPEDVPVGGRDLPEGEGCARDRDCATDACNDVRCLAGACIVVGPLLDRDGDGRAPPPCGEDCDDSDPTVYRGAPELCDGRDNDCDGSIDEGAPRSDRVVSLAVGDRTSVAIPFGSEVLITEVTSSVLWGIPVAIDGRTGSPLEIMRLSGGTSFATVAGAAAPDGRVMIVTVTDLGTTRYVVLSREGDGPARRLEGPSAIPTPADVGALEVIPFGGGFAIGYDATTPFGPERLVTTDPAVEPPIRIPLSSLPASSFGLATDGTRIAITDDEGNARFFDPDGTPVASWPLAPTLPARPLASWSGSVIAAVPDDFDFNLAHVSAATGPGATRPAPFGDASDTLRIRSTRDLVIVARSGPVQTRVQAMGGDLATYEGEALTLGRAGAPVEGVSAAETSSVIAVLGALSTSGVDLALLRACD